MYVQQGKCKAAINLQLIVLSLGALKFSAWARTFRRWILFALR
jgi:hypothetical protein